MAPSGPTRVRYVVSRRGGAEGVFVCGKVFHIVGEDGLCRLVFGLRAPTISNFFLYRRGVWLVPGLFSLRAPTISNYFLYRRGAFGLFRSSSVRRYRRITNFSYIVGLCLVCSGQVQSGIPTDKKFFPYRRAVPDLCRLADTDRQQTIVISYGNYKNFEEIDDTA